MKERKTEDVHIKVTPRTKAALVEAARRRRVSLTRLLTDAGLREAGQELAREQTEDEEQ